MIFVLTRGTLAQLVQVYIVSASDAIQLSQALLYLHYTAMHDESELVSGTGFYTVRVTVCVYSSC